VTRRGFERKEESKKTLAKVGFQAQRKDHKKVTRKALGGGLLERDRGTTTQRSRAIHSTYTNHAGSKPQNSWEMQKRVQIGN